MPLPAGTVRRGDGVAGSDIQITLHLIIVVSNGVSESGLFYLHGVTLWLVVLVPIKVREYIHTIHCMATE